MSTRCNRGFYCRSYCLLNMFRAPPCPSSGAQEYYTLVAACGILCCGFSSSWSGVELRVMCLVCRMLVYQHPANRTHNPQTSYLKNHSTKYHTQQPLYNTLELLMMGMVMPEHVEQAIRSAVKTSVASSWHFISTDLYIRKWELA